MPKTTRTRSTATRRNPLEASKKSTTNSGQNSNQKQNSLQGSAQGTNPTKEPAKSMEQPETSNTKSGDVSKDSPVDNYVLLVCLTSSDDPTITRLLSVPSNYSFLELHRVLQIAFGWAGCHAFNFSVTKPVEDGPAGDKRRAHGLRGDEVLNLQMDDDMADINPEVIKACADYTLKDVFESEKYDDLEVMYEYDHGDSWEHSIIFLGKEQKNIRSSMMIPKEMKVFCLSGEGHPCAEDCGGAGGWEDLKKVFKGKKADERKAWYKESCANGDPKGLDPYKWSILDVNQALLETFKE